MSNCNSKFVVKRLPATVSADYVIGLSTYITDYLITAGFDNSACWNAACDIVEPFEDNYENWIAAYNNLVTYSALYLDTTTSEIAQSVFTTVNSNSASWNYQGTDIKVLTASWQNAYNNLVANSALYLEQSDLSLIQSASSDWDAAYDNLVTNSALYLEQVDITDIQSASSDWDTAYNNLVTNSALYLIDTNDGDLNVNNFVYTNSAELLDIKSVVHNNSALWILSGIGEESDPIFTSWVQIYSANYESTFNTVLSNSSDWNYQGTDIKSLTANWQEAFNNLVSNSSDYLEQVDLSELQTNSANWNTSYENLVTNSAAYLVDANDGDLNVNSFVYTNSANILDINSVVQTNSALWILSGLSVETDPIFTLWASTYSANYQSTYNTVFANSANWIQNLSFNENNKTLSISNGNNVSLSSLTEDLSYYLPLTGGTITGDLSVLDVLSANIIQFNTTPTVTSTVLGNVYWEEQDNTIAIDMGNDVNQHVGFSQYIEIRANGSNIDKGTVVWATDAVSSGNSGIIRGANLLANGTVPARFLLGVACENILSGENGRISTFGVLREANLSSYANPLEVWSVGQILYPSPTIPGGWTNVEPIAPNLAMPIAFILFINNGTTKTNVTMMMRVDTGYNLNEIHDVRIINPTNGDLLQYNSILSAWENSDDINTILNSNSAKWNSTYSTVNTNSANWNYQGLDIKALTANWQSTFSTTFSNSSNWQTAYNNLVSNSSLYLADATDLSLIQSASADWNSTYSTVNSNSANWNYQGLDIKALTADYQSTFSTVNTNSSNWAVDTNDGDLNVNNFVYSNSANILDVNTVVQTNSALWILSGGSVDNETDPIFTSWASTYSANYQSTYNTVLSNSATWGTGGGVPQTLSFNESNAELTISSGNTVSLSSLSGGGNGGNGINIAGNLAYNRWQFTGVPPVSTFNITGATSEIEESYRVTIDAVIQDPVNFIVTADTITFFQAPPLSSNIVIIEQYNTSLTATVSSFTTPVTASGDFIILRVNNVDRAIRLWDF